jgi:hypothetical protein
VAEDEGGEEWCCGVVWSSKNSDRTVRLAEARERQPEALDRLPRLRFGGSDRPRSKKKPRSSDKTDRLRELTEKLKTPPSGTAEPPPPPPQPDPADTFEVDLSLAKPESRTIVGSYIQRTIPFRSASFSQVDFSSADGKYIRNARSTAIANKAGASLSLPRKKLSEGCPSTGSGRSFKLPSISTVSIDSAVGSEEWLASECLPPSERTPEQKAASPRSLTHPLGKRGPHPDENLPYSSIDGNGMKSLTTGVDRTLEGVKEESDTDSAAATSDLASSRPLSPPSRVSSLKLDNEFPDKELTSQWIESIPAALSPEPPDRYRDSPPHVYEMMPSSPPDEPSANEDNDYLKDIAEEADGDRPECPIPTTSITIVDTAEDDEGRETNYDDGPCGGNPWASSAQEEPQSPEESHRPVWPKPPERPRPRLVCQSSEEKDEDPTSRVSPRRYQLLARTDSLSEGESDNGRPNTPSRDRCSPSLFAPSDVSDCECRLMSPHSPRRYSKRPLRGPYGQMLEAEMKKPETRKFSKHDDDLKFLEEYSQGQRGGGRPRAMDDSQIKHAYTGETPKRKTSGTLPPYCPPSEAGPGGEVPVVHHQRTTSSPSQLEGCSNQKQADPPHQLLAQLLKGSSERSLPETTLLNNPPPQWKVCSIILLKFIYISGPSMSNNCSNANYI